MSDETLRLELERDQALQRAADAERRLELLRAAVVIAEHSWNELAAGLMRELELLRDAVFRIQRAAEHVAPPKGL